MDEAFRPGGSSAEAVPEAAHTGETGWKQLGTFEQTRKENVQQPGRWAGVHAPIALTHSPNNIECAIANLCFLAREVSATSSSTCVHTGAPAIADLYLLVYWYFGVHRSKAEAEAILDDGAGSFPGDPCGRGTGAAALTPQGQARHRGWTQPAPAPGRTRPRGAPAARSPPTPQGMLLELLSPQFDISISRCKAHACALPPWVQSNGESLPTASRNGLHMDLV